MGQEFFINSEQLETKIRQLLPSQGGAGAGFDLSAQTQIVPIVDLTETAQGSLLRADLQTALSQAGDFVQIDNNLTTISSTVGFIRLFGNITYRSNRSSSTSTKMVFTVGGVQTKFYEILCAAASATEAYLHTQFDFIVFNPAGSTIQGITGGSEDRLTCRALQVATVDGTLVNPLGFSST